MLIHNAQAKRSTYPNALRKQLNHATTRENQRLMQHWSLLHHEATPLWDMPKLAMQCGVSTLHIKDESVRSSLGSFKALGAPIALVRLISRIFDQVKSTNFTKGLLFGEHKKEVANITVVSATDGNHGRALAAAAQSIGCQCVVVLHANVTQEREAAIASYGARIIRIEGGYDASVAEAARLAQQHGWHVVSDTSYPGYESIPRDVMQGYAQIAAEVEQQISDTHVLSATDTFTHVILQGGVGGLAAGITSYFWELYADKRPRFIVVEPTQADCLFQSARQGKPASASGQVDSLMAGLACGETSLLAWQFLAPVIDDFMLIDDSAVPQAMRVLAGIEDVYGKPQCGHLTSDVAQDTHNTEQCLSDMMTKDIPLVAGESGAAGLAALLTLTPEQRESLALNAHSRVLLINTEGATAPSVYRDCVGQSAIDIFTCQQQWKIAHQPTATITPSLLTEEAEPCRTSRI